MGRPKKKIPLVLAIVIIIVALLSGNLDMVEELIGIDLSEIIPTSTTIEENIEDGEFVSALVVDHVDGDTVKVKIGEVKYTLRFIGIDTPETVHPSKPVQFYGKEASAFTKKKLLGKTVYLQMDVSDSDKYGRLLRYIWLEKPNEINEDEIKNKMFNAIQVAEGYAKVFTYPPDVKYNEIFLKLEQEARENNKGLWNEELEKKFDN